MLLRQVGVFPHNRPGFSARSRHCAISHGKIDGSFSALFLCKKRILCLLLVLVIAPLQDLVSKSGVRMCVCACVYETLQHVAI